MICRAIRIATWPGRVAYRAAEEGIWLARAAAEVYGYGISIGGPSDYEPDWEWLTTDDTVPPYNPVDIALCEGMRRCK